MKEELTSDLCARRAAGCGQFPIRLTLSTTLSLPTFVKWTVTFWWVVNPAASIGFPSVSVNLTFLANLN